MPDLEVTLQILIFLIMRMVAKNIQTNQVTSRVLNFKENLKRLYNTQCVDSEMKNYRV